MKTICKVFWIVSLSLVPFTGFCQYDDCVGKTVALAPYGDKGIVHVGATKKNYNAVTGNLMAEDSANYMTMVLGHRVIEVDRGTQVKVLAINFWEKTAEVEVLDGTYKGNTGWVLLNTVTGY